MTLRLFVYGTLRSDIPADALPAAARLARQMLYRRARHEGVAFAPGRLVAPAWYPGLIEGEGPGYVRGEVWRLDADTLARLDWYEGRDYVRRIRRVQLERVVVPGTAVARVSGSDSGRLLTAHVYVYVRDTAGLPVIPTGDFADWLAESRDHRDDRTP